MSMIKCPECGKDVSSEAYQCPGCGYPLRPPPRPPPLPPQTPSPMRPPTRTSSKGLSVGCIVALVIVPIIGFVALLTAIALPAFLSHRVDARRGLCINNQRLIDHAKEVLAIKNNWTSGQVIAESEEGIWAQLDPFIDGTNLLSCPEAPGRHYVYGPIDTPPKCPVADAHPDHVYNPY